MQELASLEQYTVGLAGCGGLGSNCAAALTRAGIGHLVLADFDVVSQSNLNRQFFFIDQVGMKKVTALGDNLRRINPGLRIDAHDVKVNPANVVRLFRDCDVIVEAFDLAGMKKMLIETVLSLMPSTYLVSGLGLAGWGNNNAFREIINGKLIVCGDFTSEVSDSQPPIAPRVGIVANMQANAVLSILLK